MIRTLYAHNNIFICIIRLLYYKALPTIFYCCKQSEKINGTSDKIEKNWDLKRNGYLFLDVCSKLKVEEYKNSLNFEILCIELFIIGYFDIHDSS